MHSGTAIAIRDVPAAASHGTAGVLAGCQGSGCLFLRRLESCSARSGVDRRAGTRVGLAY